ncbi:UDP-N-acetylmuramoyl-tripeptide--D-alanyl-D-alanine ligase [Proteus hauseri]|uniref:UDP-N-acetylmuramoyl-tripeptide--D-alanyl-D- alanine ligase n=1 Tax=Proteus hauseri TaxID=183417 RepID=UPI0032DB0314
MIALSLETIAQIAQGTLCNITQSQANQQIINSISTDSRNIEAHCLFIALAGERFDAHDFIADVKEKGAVAVLVNRQIDVNCPQVIVKDTQLAMGAIAAHVRSLSHAKVVALTGSSGKTSVKEMTASILRHCGETLYTHGNLNNNIGVPLTLFRLTPEHHFAVIELGANHIGEIAYTVDMVKPDSALVNNLFSAHIEGFGSLEGIAQAKGEIFAGLKEQGSAIINGESNDIALWQHHLNERQTQWTFSLSSQGKADFYPTDIVVNQLTTDFTLHTPEGCVEITLPLPGRHNIANALAASALALSVGATLESVKQGLATLNAVPGRLYPIELSAGKIVLDDTYNANDGSMIAGLQVLSQLPGYKIFVAGDMAELGKDSEKCHRDVGRFAHDAGIDSVLTVGHHSQFISEESLVGQHFIFKADLLLQLIPLLQQHDVVSVLVKGSRSSAMEDIVNALKECFEC